MADRSALRGYVDPAMRRRLVTPEGIDLGLTLASGGQRAGAFLLDLTIMVALLIAISVALMLGFMASGGAAGEIFMVLWLLGFFVLRNGYFILCETGPRAATWGKRICGVRVVARSGARLTADAVIARNLMREVEVYLPLSFLGYRAAEGIGDQALTIVGLAWTCLFLFFPLLNKDRLRVGDLLAGTWVINAPRQRLTVDLMRAEPEAAAGYTFTEAQLDAYGIYELQTLEQVLRDRQEEAMAAVSFAIRNKLGMGEVDSTEGFLTAYYEALRRRLERKLLFGRRRADKHDR
jgi:uncharacterized RDD family membrane protein YckC